MFVGPLASRIRRLEAERARENRQEIARALNQGQITKRDLIRWGIFTAGGAVAMKNGLSAFAPSAYAQVPTGSPRSDVRGAPKFKDELPRPYLVDRFPMQQLDVSNPVTGSSEKAYAFSRPNGNLLDELPARRTSYHNLYNAFPGAAAYQNPVTGVGPIEGRPPAYTNGKDYFAHQRWGELAPKVGFIMSIGQVEERSKLHSNLPDVAPNALWTCGKRIDHDYTYSSGSGSFRQGYYGARSGYIAPPLIQARYGEPFVMRIYNDLPVPRHLNGGFGRNEISIHTHNAHNAAESDGASNAFFFPGQFYDYHNSTILARHDAVPGSALFNKMDDNFKTRWYRDPRCSTISDEGNRVQIPGDFREIQGSMWFHDHRFFFTAENVYKGMYGLFNMYSGPDNGNEEASHAGALRLPSGRDKPWGNLDYDINLAITTPALDRDGQPTFDIFDTDGYVGDLLCVNGAYAPFFRASRRRYRFRLLNASMARFYQLALVDAAGTPVPFHVISTDGNLLPRPVLISSGILDRQGPAERFDIVVDFARLPDTTRELFFVNLLYHVNGRGPEGRVSIARALQGFAADPAVGAFMKIELDGTKPRDLSVDLFAAPVRLTEQIPVDPKPVRVREFRFGRAEVTARDPITGECTPDCGEAEKFPWAIKVDGKEWHAFNATRISSMVPAEGDVEHWVLVNNGGGWDHPVHLHLEEGITINRGRDPTTPTERLARKDVWRLGKGGEVRIQLRFSEFGGAYVQHCHNTVHEDWSMILRMQVLSADPNSPQYEVTPTPLPRPEGVEWGPVEWLTEAIPNGVRVPTKPTSSTGE